MADTPIQLENGTDWSNYLATLDLDTEKDRLQTLYHWPPGKYLKTDLHKVVEDGFYYFGDSDIIRCRYCSLNLKHWNNSTKTYIDHRTYSNTCSLLTGAKIRNIPLEATDRAPAYLSYVDKSKRIDSFQNSEYFKEHSDKLADAGFFNAGFNRVLVCFQCGKRDNDWTPDVDVWETHIILNHACPHVTKHKNEYYINQVKKKNLIKLTPVVNPHQNVQLNMSITNNCSLCQQRQTKKLLMPCRHQLCPECCASLNVCPFCYEIANEIITIYL